MAYPNISASDVRKGVKHVTVAQVTDARITDDLIPESTRWVEAKLSGNIDLVALKALPSTPDLFKDAVIFKCRSAVLKDQYGSARNVATDDIKGWEDDAQMIINGIIDGSQKLLQSDGTVVPTGVNYVGVSTNKDDEDENHAPYFGHGENGEFKKDPNDNTVYNDPN
jgi:hypothetical protein